MWGRCGQWQHVDQLCRPLVFRQNHDLARLDHFRRYEAPEITLQNRPGRRLKLKRHECARFNLSRGLTPDCERTICHGGKDQLTESISIARRTRCRLHSLTSTSVLNRWWDTGSRNGSRAPRRGRGGFGRRLAPGSPLRTEALRRWSKASGALLAAGVQSMLGSDLDVPEVYDQRHSWR